MSRKIYLILKALNKNCYLNNIFYYHKTNLIRAPLEVAITLYVVEFYILFTNIFIKDSNNSLEISQLLIMIFAPIIFAILLCAIYSFLIIIYITKRLYKHIYETIKSKNTTHDKYEEIDKVFKEYFLKIHGFGTFCYIMSSIIIIFVNLLALGENPKNNIPLISIIFIVGLVSGLLWNILGYYSDQTINWNKIYINIGPTPHKLKHIKFKYYIKYRILNSVILISYILLTLIALLRIPQNVQILELNGGLESLYLLITIFFTIITVYMKQIYQLYYNEKNSNSSFFKLDFFILESKNVSINKKRG